MKKILLFFVALVATLSMNAQTTEIYKGTTKEATYSGADVTVSFGENSITVKQGTTVNLTYFGSDYKVVSKELPSTTGTAKRKDNIDVNWVQLWKDGPKFAEYNVGASSATDYGYYLAWGGITDKDATNNTGSAVLSGSDDSAYNLWGEHWRMPTNTDFSTLMSNCTCTWETNYNETGVKGLLCTGKGDYSSNSIFLPAAGYCDSGNGKVYEQGVGGYYWSSNPNGSASAIYLYFDSGCQDVRTIGRRNGYFVRPIYVEEVVAVTGVSLNKTELKVGVGNTETLSAEVNPTNATNKKVKDWTSSDETVATVDAYGKVKGVKTGECFITVTTEDGEKKDTCKVKVVVPTTGYAKATIGGKDVDVKWIQLWENGPKFAEYNVGVTDGNKSSIGEYYAWSSTDIATSVWGSNWRMPTIAELQALLDNCYCAWYNRGSYLGCSGRGDDYKTNTINLPKTGYKHPDMKELQNSDYVYYWSSTPDISGYAKLLNGAPGFEEDYGPAWTDETSGVEAKCCVRAVLNEPK